MYFKFPYGTPNGSLYVTAFHLTSAPGCSVWLSTEPPQHFVPNRVGTENLNRSLPSCGFRNLELSSILRN